MDMKTSPLATLADASLLKTNALINGEWIAGASRFDVHDPATGQKLADVANLGAAETEAALKAADKAWPAWRAKTAKERGAILMKWFALLHQHADDLARAAVMAIFHGMPNRAYNVNDDAQMQMGAWFDAVADAFHLPRPPRVPWDEAEQRIAPFGVTRGQWYFLRALWIEDGLSQRELSARVGTREPTTVTALRSMEKDGYVRRVQSREDRRRTHVWLTAAGRRLEKQLLPVARQIVDEAERGIAVRDVEAFRRTITRMTKNLDELLDRKS
jgi:DNA-binding MarR family transcriptional regulator